MEPGILTFARPVVIPSYFLKHHRANRRFYVLSPRLETLTCGLHPVKLNIYKDEVRAGFALACVIVCCCSFSEIPFPHT